jgi:hypothetical protein
MLKIGILFLQINKLTDLRVNDKSIQLFIGKDKQGKAKKWCNGVAA